MINIPWDYLWLRDVMTTIETKVILGESVTISSMARSMSMIEKTLIPKEAPFK